MALNISIPQRSFERGMNENPASYGTGTIVAGQQHVSVACGELTKDSMVKVLQNATSVGANGKIMEEKYNSGGTYQRTDGIHGAFYVATGNLAVAANDITFDWIVLPRGSI